MYEVTGNRLAQPLVNGSGHEYEIATGESLVSLSMRSRDEDLLRIPFFGQLF